MGEPRWKRIVFKPSGEALAGPSGSGLDAATLDATGGEIAAVRANGTDVAVVVGGGNFWRGRTGAMSGMDATQSDHIGMLGTVMNALALQDALERVGQDTRVQSAIEMPRIAEPYIRRRAMRHLEKGRVVIFAAGTGNPFFTTDTAAALRAAEMDANALLKGTHSGVDGVYSADPRIDASDDEVRRDQLHRRDDQGPQGDGRDSHRVLPGQPDPDRRVRHGGARRTGADPQRRARRHDGALSSHPWSATRIRGRSPPCSVRWRA